MTPLPNIISYAALARKLGRPQSTVNNWFKYGIPKDKRAEVQRAVRELSNASIQSSDIMIQEMK